MNLHTYRFTRVLKPDNVFLCLPPFNRFLFIRHSRVKLTETIGDDGTNRPSPYKITNDIDYIQ